ncbi:uncharacterized protein ATNIH1004_010137 [Aspergillus tanneri]|uniref:Berberine/berberine-like domain-containing protein n=1 Tax=Aspergillus tanneri TaxID=1220188 RepID=A0A5M9M937_9EURO|nr:uncharacterized protein ATNIH1004_010137 [Aspergillus tanneri]KAA8643368.1 hypothetical protein ATNIH1004_010137 [Aspergillus tanneri]
MSDFVIEEDSYQVPGYFTLYYTASFAHNPSVYGSITSEFRTSTLSISSIKGMNWPGYDGWASKYCSSDRFFPNESDSPLMRKTIEGLLGSIEQITKATGVFRSFKYLNYADARQNPVDGYGKKAKAALQAASKKYDPEGFKQVTKPYLLRYDGGKGFNSSGLLAVRASQDTVNERKRKCKE